MLAVETANDFKTFYLFILLSAWKHNFKAIGRRGAEVIIIQGAAEVTPLLLFESSSFFLISSLFSKHCFCM